jgi:hypothetical protein
VRDTEKSAGCDLGQFTSLRCSAVFPSKAGRVFLPPLVLFIVLFFRRMHAKAITPVLNVSDMPASFAWFEKWGWKKCWDWGTPPTFGAVGSGECEIFLCQGAQGGRGKGVNSTTFQEDGDETLDKGVWMSVWVDDVDEVYKQCLAAALDVTFPPTNMPWKVREMHLRHPDGHVFRVSKGVVDAAHE